MKHAVVLVLVVLPAVVRVALMAYHINKAYNQIKF